MQPIVIDIDELRTIANLAVSASEKMNESNAIIGTVISKHDWKCPERVPLDETLEKIKGNTVILDESFTSFSTEIVNIANGFTDYVNDQIREDTEYVDDVAGLLSRYSSEGIVTEVSSGNNIGAALTDLQSTSMDASNIASLSGADHGINIVDFSLFME